MIQQSKIQSKRVCFSHDGNTLASSIYYKSICFWDINHRQQIERAEERQMICWSNILTMQCNQTNYQNLQIFVFQFVLQPHIHICQLIAHLSCEENLL